jgi:hypothetical protein
MELLSVGTAMSALAAAAGKSAQQPIAGMQSAPEPSHHPYQLRSRRVGLAADRSSFYRSSTPPSATPSLISSDSKSTSSSSKKVRRKPDKARTKCRSWSLNPALQAAQMVALSSQKSSEAFDVYPAVDPNLASLSEKLSSQCHPPCDLSANPTLQETSHLANSRKASSSEISRSSTVSTFTEDSLSDESNSSTPSFQSLVQSVLTPPSHFCDPELRSRCECDSHDNLWPVDISYGEYDQFRSPGVYQCSVCPSSFIDQHRFWCVMFSSNLNGFP